MSARPPRRRVILLGATGSIGRQACAVIEQHHNRFQVVGAVAGSDVGALADVAARFDVEHVAVVAPSAGVTVPTGWGSGLDAACSIASLECDVVLVAITGAAALQPTLAAISRGSDIALATKEVMVMAGDVVTARARATGSRFLPVDSEHSALWQCLRGEDPATVARLILTASGGPFRDRDASSLAAVTVAEALRHPNWSMGPKVTIDSATMMNKGLEIIEAHHLFGIDYSCIDVAIHPSSMVHSLVEFSDGATMAQIGVADMRLPIALAINDGARLAGVCAAVNIRGAPPLEFRDVDPEQFPAVELARRAGERGGAAPAVLNAANEIAVQAFLDERIRFTDIVPLVAQTIDAAAHLAATSLDDIVGADAWARDHARSSLATSPRTP